MAGIYTRDNINYSTMLQNAIANRARAAERQAQYIQNQGKLWGDTVTNVGNTIGKGAFYSYDPQSLAEKKAELAKLEEEQAKYNEQVEQRKKFDEIFNNPEKLAKDQAARESYIEKQYNDYSDYKPNGTYDMDGYRPFDTREGAYIAPQVGGAESVAMSGYKPNLNYKPSVEERRKYSYDSNMRDIYRDLNIQNQYDNYEDYEPYINYMYGYRPFTSNPYSEILQGTYRRGR